MKHTWNHDTIRTPIDTLNIIGAGGVDAGTISELAGPPGSGKSAYAYDCASNFLTDNLDGVVLILDPELSTDLVRLEHTFKLDMTRVIILNARTLEDGYTSIYRVLNDQNKQAVAGTTTQDFLRKWDLKEAIKLMKSAGLEPDLSLLDDAVSSAEIIEHAQQSLTTLLAFRGLLRPQRPTPVLVVWDTIAASKPAAEVEAAMNGKDPRDAGGIGLRARINEINLAIVMSSLFNKPVTVFLLNQIRTAGIGTYKPTEVSSGGNALKHANHYYLWFSKNQKVYDEGLKMYIGSSSKVSVRKSKFGPTIDDIPIYINDQVGGRIIPDDEAALVACDLGILKAAGGWWKINDGEKSYRWNDISKNAELRQVFFDCIARHFRKNYMTLNIVYEKLGLSLGSLSQTDMEECKKSYTRNVSKPILVSENSNGSDRDPVVPEDEDDPIIVDPEGEETPSESVELDEDPIIVGG